MGTTVDYEFARTVVDLVGRLLYLLDYYSGHDWARGLIDEEMLTGKRPPTHRVS